MLQTFYLLRKFARICGWSYDVIATITTYGTLNGEYLSRALLVLNGQHDETGRNINTSQLSPRHVAYIFIQPLQQLTWCDTRSIFKRVDMPKTKRRNFSTVPKNYQMKIYFLSRYFEPIFFYISGYRERLTIRATCETQSLRFGQGFTSN